MASGEIEEFSCVWNYDWWEASTTKEYSETGEEGGL